MREQFSRSRRDSRPENGPSGGGAATILVLLEACGLITAAGVIPTAIVGFIMAVGGAVLLANEHGNGVCIYHLWFPGGGFIVVPR